MTIHNEPDDGEARHVDDADIEWFDPWSSKLKFDKGPTLPKLPEVEPGSPKTNR